MKKTLLLIFAVLMVACQPAATPVSPGGSDTPSPATATPNVPTFPAPATLPPPTLTPASPLTPAISPMPQLVPDFAHIIVFFFENQEFGSVIGDSQMPNYNAYARQNALLSAYYAIRHPSLPNYIALIAGDTFGITSDCHTCYIDAPNLADLIEKSGRTWKTYQESMPSPCFIGDSALYFQKHNPFIYFTPVREDAQRCQRSIVPLTQLDADLAAQTLPNFAFIMPNICNSAHNCALSVADQWLGALIPKLQAALEAEDKPYLIVLTWDEGQGDHGCCGLSQPAGGRVATVLISPQVKAGFQDDTSYNHYSLLKTISAAWDLPFLGHAADDNNVLITAPWK